MKKEEILEVRDYFGYSISVEDLEFIENMEGYIESQCGFVINAPYYGMSLDPVGNHIEIWHDGECVDKRTGIKDLLLGFEINGKKIIELISDFDFA